MECPSCQHENRQEARFCEQCATELLRQCQKCGHSVSATAKFCEACSHDLSQTVTRSEGPTKPAEPSAPTGERRQATVLFSDLSGYTAMNEKLDPEEVEGIMSRIKAEAVKIVEAHGGIVSQFVGDEVLALFGIPTAHEDDPRRAVRAALELHELAHTISPEVEEKIGRTLLMHTGINSGLIVTSTRDQRDGTIGVTGDTVNTGARLKAFAGDDEILVSPDTQRRIAPFFELEKLPPAEMKGKTLPVAPYCVLGESDVATRFDAAEQRGFTPFVGREQELDTLKSCLEKAVSGKGQLVTVVGEAGVGKSRLIYEFRQSLQREQINMLEGRCQSYGKNTPYLPLIDALRRGLRLRPDDSPEALHDAVVINLKAIDPALERYIPACLHLLSISSDEYALPETLAGEELRRNLQEAYAAITTQSASNEPLVFFLGDWHWADEASNAAIVYLLGLIDLYPIMLVVNYRPEFAGNWVSPANHTPIGLLPLDAANGERIVCAVLEADGLPGGFNELIHERTGGNPFFIEEMCSNLKEEGAVQVRDGKATLTVSSEELELPGTVQAVIRSRLDRLDNDHREVLRLASVIGREFGRRLLEKAHSGADPLTPLLETLKGQELIQQVRVLPEVAYLFKHVLTQVVVYETLLIERRKALHELVGRALEELYTGRLEEHYEALAYHFRNSDDLDSAVKYLELAGDKAAGYFSLEDARNYYLEAVEMLDGAERTPELMIKRVDLSLKSATISIFAPTQQQIEVLETSRRYAQEQKDVRREAEICLWLGRLHYTLGRTGREARIEFERCLELAETLHDGRLRGRSISSLGRMCFHTAEFEKGIAYLKEGISIAESTGDLIDLAFSQNMLARIYSWMGDFQTCSKFSEASIKTARSIKNPERESGHLVLESLSRVLKGDWRTSIATASQGEEIASRIGNKFMAGIGTISKGISTFMTGDREAGRRLILEGDRWRKERGNIGYLVWRAFVAEVSALDGQPAQATELAQEILALAETTGQTTGNTVAHRALALAAAQETPPDWEKVNEHMKESISLAERTGARPNLAIGHFRYAELLQQKGAPALARVQLEQAAALFAEMEMTWWLEQAEIIGKTLYAG